MPLTLMNEDNAGVPQALEQGIPQDVSLDLIDKSTRYCRMPISTQSRRFVELQTSIASQGQISPVILRPSPTKPGRFDTVAGHRRILAIECIGKGSTVRAIVAELDDYQALLVGGMDNTTNQPLSYAEKVWHSISLDGFSFSRNQLDKERLALDALSLRPGELSRFRDIHRTVSRDILEAIGPAHKIGKDLWWNFALKIAEDRITHLENLRKEFVSPEFQALESNDRFERARNIVGVGKLQHRTITVDGKESLLGSITERAGGVSMKLGTRSMATTTQQFLPILRECEANPKLAAHLLNVIPNIMAEFNAVQDAVQQAELLPA